MRFAAALAVALSSAGFACNSSAAGEADASSPPLDDGGGERDAAAPSDAPVIVADAGGGEGDAAVQPPACAPPSSIGRGLSWVRNNPMFISGLIPGLAAPDAAGASDYFDVFGANAVHLWENGLPSRMDDWAALAVPAFRWVSWLKFDGTSHDGGQLIGGYAANPPGRIGYQLGDEPRTWAEYNAMVAGLEAVKTADPAGLRYVNFSHYADDIDAFLADYGANQRGDLISYDVYSGDKKAYGRLRLFRDAAAAHGMPSWCYIRYYASAPSTNFWSDSDMRWSVFLHALNGCTGFSWFIYQIDAGHELNPAGFTAQGNYASGKRPTYAQAAAINSELANLGRTLTQLRSTDVRYNASVALLAPAGTTAWSKGAGKDPYLDGVSASGSFQDLVLGFFEDDLCEPYVMVQNPNHPDGSLPTDSTAATTVTLEFDFSQTADLSLDQSKVEYLDKLSGAIETLLLTPLGDGRARLTVPLAAGDIFFFKYRTANAFVQQPL